jgi:hypothetical protein
MPTPKWLKEPAHKRKTHTFGTAVEKQVMRKLGGRLTPRSGAGRMKGDGRVVVTKDDGEPVELHVEVKATAKQGFRVSRPVMDKLRKQSGYRRHPVLVVQCEGKQYVVTPIETFQRITGIKL